MTSVVRRALGVAVACRCPVLLWGVPGTGKTSAVTEMAAASEWPLEVVIASIREPSDFAGLPVVSNGSVDFAPPRWAARLVDAGRGVLFLDEISTAPPAVQAALLRVVLERHVGDLRIPDEVAIVAAANATDQAADGWDLAAPLANRFCHLDWQISASEWADGMIGGFDPVTIRSLDLVELARRTAHYDAVIGSFVARRSGLLSQLPTDSSVAGRAWPSPRTWSMAAKLLAAGDLAGAGADVSSMLVAGCVGPAAALEFAAWAAESDLPDAEAVLSDPASFIVPERGDRAHSALSAIVAAVRADLTPQRWASAVEAVGRAVDSGHADLAVVAIRALVKCRPTGAPLSPVVLRSLSTVLREAGLFDRLTTL